MPFRLLGILEKASVIDIVAVDSQEFGSPMGQSNSSEGKHDDGGEQENEDRHGAKADLST